MIVVLAAMQEEFEAIVAFVKNPMVKYTPFGELVEGEIFDQKVVCAQTGIGKSVAAATTTYMIERYSVSMVINVGSAGGLSDDLNIGDIVVVDKVSYHDFDLSAFDYPLGWANEKYVFYPDSDLNQRALSKEQFLEHKIVKGSLVSGDQFIHEKDTFKKIIKEFEGVKAVDMEGAAIGHITSLYATRFAIIRSISDLALADDNPIDFSTYIKKAAANSAALVNHLIYTLSNQ